MPSKKTETVALTEPVKKKRAPPKKAVISEPELDTAIPNIVKELDTAAHPVEELNKPVAKKRSVKKSAPAPAPEPVPEPASAPVPEVEPASVKPVAKKRSAKKVSIKIPEQVSAIADTVPVKKSRSKVKKVAVSSSTDCEEKVASDVELDTADSDEDSAQLRQENVILQLNIDAASATQIDEPQLFESQFFNYDSTLKLPDAYNRHECNGFASQPCNLTNDKDEEEEQIITSKTNRRKSDAKAIHSGKRVFDHLSEFVIRDEWPLSTNIACFWCCHTFSNTPFGIPTKYNGGKFYVTGCFCSLECATSYNFYSKELNTDVHESYSLINLLSRRIQYKDTVRMAPPRHALKMFGGYMDIYEFRGKSDSSKVISTHTYPMVAIIQQLEEVNDLDNYTYRQRKNMFIPVDKQKLFMLETKMKLERTKPLFHNKNTLDHTMNLKVE